MSGGLKATLDVRRSESFRLNVRLSVPAGRTTVLLGPNGAGKSTAVAALVGTVPLDAGHIELEGVILDDPANGTHVPTESRQVGVVFQDYLLFPHLSVLENVAFGPRSRGMRRTEARTRAWEWIERLKLDGLESHRPRDLSGGEAQRVALARTLAAEPRLLLLDEPLAALDVAARSQVRRTLAEHLGQFAGPRILITHDPVEASLFADEIAVIENGHVTQRGSVDDIRLKPRTRYAAEFGGLNFMRGNARDGRVYVGKHVLHVAEHEVAGPVLVTIRPRAISVHLNPPEGSYRNTWPTVVARIERLGHRVRLLTEAPLLLAVEVTAEASVELGLAPGSEIWLALKATEIGVQADSTAPGHIS